MSRHIKLSPSFKEFDFLDHYKRNRSQKYIIRCLGCHHIQSGKGYKEVGRLLRMNKNSVIAWVDKFESGGIEALLSISAGRGRKPKLSPEFKEDFCSSVVSLQEERGGGRITADDIVEMVEKKYGVRYTRSGMYNVLKKMKMSWVSARSKHPDTDKAAQESFKKTSVIK